MCLKADCSLMWIDMFRSIDESFVKHWKRLKVKQCDNERPPMFQPCTDDKILREVSYRICAIRETFEETGVLLARQQVDGLEEDSNIQYVCVFLLKLLLAIPLKSFVWVINLAQHLQNVYQ